MGLRVALDSPQRLLERALTEPRLLRTPLVRNGGKVTIGHLPDEWRAWGDAPPEQAECRHSTGSSCWAAPRSWRRPSSAPRSAGLGPARFKAGSPAAGATRPPPA